MPGTLHLALKVGRPLCGAGKQSLCPPGSGTSAVSREGEQGWDREPAVMAVWGFSDVFASELDSDLEPASMLGHC